MRACVRAAEGRKGRGGFLPEELLLEIRLGEVMQRVVRADVRIVPASMRAHAQQGLGPDEQVGQAGGSRWGTREMGMGYRLIASVHMAEHAMGAFLSVAVVNTFTSALQC